MDDNEYFEIRVSINDRDWLTNFTGCCLVIILSWVVVGLVIALPLWLIFR